MEFYKTSEFWTAAAVFVALFMPLFILWWNSRPKKSKLVIKGSSIVNQDIAEDENEKQQRRLLNVGRIIISNEGKYIAKSVEAFIETIEWDDKEREDFFPMPLHWTHGQLNEKGPTKRDIYPNQTVFLDFFNHIFDSYYVGDPVLFAVAAGLEVDNLSKMNIGTSFVKIKMYQESGQVLTFFVKAEWDGKTVPKISVISKEIIKKQ